MKSFIFSEVLKTFLHNSRQNSANYLPDPVTLPQIQDRISQKTVKRLQNHLKLSPTRAATENSSLCFSFDVLFEFGFLVFGVFFAIFILLHSSQFFCLNFLLSATTFMVNFISCKTFCTKHLHLKSYC